ncbi:MAG: hypothetical protein GF331_22580 [Chitinivibrionales bacterium]|nr:hypothetical protein [Chitinivibrionales bacterium]
MNRIAIVIVMLGLTRAFGLPCDAPYYINGVTEHLRTASLGATEQVLDEQSSEPDPELSGLTIIDTNIVYSVIKQFEGECGQPAQKPLIFATRPAGSGTLFGEQTETDLYTEMFDSATHPLLNSSFDWWYAIGPAVAGGHVRVDSARYVIGREGDGDLFSTWYGTAYLIDSTRSMSGLWGVAYEYFHVVSHFDSATLDNSLLASWRAEEWNGDSRRGKYILQLIKVDYDTTRPAVRFRSHGRVPLALTGATGGNVTVFDPLGRVVATLPKGVAVPRSRGCYILRLQRGERALSVKDMIVH